MAKRRSRGQTPDGAKSRPSKTRTTPSRRRTRSSASGASDDTGSTPRGAAARSTPRRRSRRSVEPADATAASGAGSGAGAGSARPGGVPTVPTGAHASTKPGATASAPSQWITSVDVAARICQEAAVLSKTPGTAGSTSHSTHVHAPYSYATAMSMNATLHHGPLVRHRLVQHLEDVRRLLAALDGHGGGALI